MSVMKDHAFMLRNGLCNALTAAHRAARCFNMHEKILLTLALCALAQSGEVLAADAAGVTAPLSNLDPFDSRLPLPASAKAPRSASSPVARSTFDSASTSSAVSTPLNAAQSSVPQALGFEPREFSATEFNPRRRGLVDADATAGASYGNDSPMFRSTTVWQQLNEFRARDRVRVLTLWENSGSSVSLQAGKRGDPSLQWSSRWMNRGGASQGVLDRLFTASLNGIVNGTRSGMQRSSSVATPQKQLTTPSVAASK
jgi:hypothetical protein